jgi:hypothetical protein
LIDIVALFRFRYKSEKSNGRVAGKRIYIYKCNSWVRRVSQHLKRGKVKLYINLPQIPHVKAKLTFVVYRLQCEKALYILLV